MRNTIGYHVVISGYGLWLPGDDRGHWSESWDIELGFFEPHTLHEGDPVRRRMAQERMSHAPVSLSPEMIDAAAQTLAHCARESDWRFVAASIEPTHTHLLMTYSARPLETTVKWVKDRMTKAIHRETDHAGPVWCKGRWRSFIYDERVWETTRRYVERHNERRGVGPRPYGFLRE